MNTYVAVMTFVGKADGAERFLDIFWAALDGDEEAQREIHGGAPQVVVIRGEQEASDDV